MAASRTVGRPRRGGLPILRVSLFLAASIPFLVTVWDTFNDGLGADPVKAITHRTGWWTLALLLVTLSITPIRRLTGWNQVIKYRRMIGLFAFFYACLHLLTYIVLDQTLDLSYVGEDIAKRPYITVGFTAWLLLLPLALTSTRGWVRRLGKKWQRLHRLVYVSAILGVIHFLWLVKADIREPLIFGCVLTALLSFRIIWGAAHRRPARSPRRHSVAAPMREPVGES